MGQGSQSVEGWSFCIESWVGRELYWLVWLLCVLLVSLLFEWQPLPSPVGFVAGLRVVKWCSCAASAVNC